MKAVVIGAGIVGVTAALTLAEADIDVVMLERGQIAGEASGLNAGIIGGGGWGNAPDVNVALRMGSRDRYIDLVDNRGHEIGFDRT
ncbi:MAG: FAD-binding oxidoreductase, partial [Acidimicrobiaceae bacterium]|nr:FAD-binding oxidoreductase [Acidimicrobiaceae bacterium]